MPGRVDDIIAFIEVVERGSFRAAADAIGVTTAAVSKRIAGLEARLGVELIRRTTRQVEITDAGRALYDEVHQIPKLMAEGEARAQTVASAATGPLRVVMPTYLASFARGRQAVSEYAAAFPNVALELNVDDDPLCKIDDGYDLLLVGKLPDRQLPSSTLVGRRLLKLPAALYAAPSYLADHPAPEHPSGLVEHNCLSYSDRHDWHFTSPEGERVVVEVQGSLTTNSNEILRGATLQGLGITYSFPSVFEADVAAGRVTRLLEVFTERSVVEVHVLYRKSKHIAPRARAFVDMLIAQGAREG